MEVGDGGAGGGWRSAVCDCDRPATGRELRVEQLAGGEIIGE